jgi:hypothetical protein
MNCHMIKSRRKFVVVILGLVIFLCPALGLAQGQQSPPAQQERIVPLQRVAILPFLIVKPARPEQRVVKGLWENFFFRTGDLPARSGPEVTASFQRQLNALGRCELITQEQAQSAVEGMDPQTMLKDPIGTAAQIGRDFNLYAVVIGGVYRFEQRKGSALGAESPASAAFDAHLVRVADKKVLWSGRFDETQHSLSENVLKVTTFLKGGAQWVTVERWAELGAESVLRTFPTLSR